MRIKFGLFICCMIVLISCGWYKTFVGKANELSVVKDNISKGNEYLEKGYYYEASECYKIAENEQESGELEEIISFCYYMLGDEDSSYTWANKAYEGGYQTEYIYQIMVDRCLKMGDKKAAYDTLQNAKENGIESEDLEEQYMDLKSGYSDMYFTYLDVSDFAYGNAIVWEEDTCYVVNYEGRKIIPGNDYEIYDISSDKCIDERWSDTNILYAGYNLGMCRFFDSDGYIRISPEDVYDYVGAPKDGMILVKKGELWGYIDTDFNEIDISYEDATGFANERAAVKKDGLWMIVDKSLTPVNDERYEEVLTDDFMVCSSSGGIIVKRDGCYSLLSPDGDVILDDIEEAKSFIGEKSYAAVKKDGMWKLVDSKGEIIYEGDEEELDSTCCDLVGYREGDLWGYKYIDGSGIIEPRFSKVKAFNSKGYAFVMENNAWSMIKMEGFCYEE